MYAFEYHRPNSLSGALADLGKEDAKALAGGMTLLPTMKQRLAAPSALVELRDVAGAFRNLARRRQSSSAP